jgi:hypothetical protein
VSLVSTLPSVSTTTRSRAAWLLRSLRLHAQDPALRNGRRFAAAFPDGVSPSQVTRWETGQTPLTYRVLRGYERLLGLDRRSVVALVDSAVRLERGIIGAPLLGRPVIQDEAVRQWRLLSLVERADSPEPMGSHHWDDLTALLSGWWYPALRERGHRRLRPAAARLTRLTRLTRLCRPGWRSAPAPTPSTSPTPSRSLWSRRPTPTSAPPSTPPAAPLPVIRASPK